MKSSIYYQNKKEAPAYTGAAKKNESTVNARSRKKRGTGGQAVPHSERRTGARRTGEQKEIYSLLIENINKHCLNNCQAIMSNKTKLTACIPSSLFKDKQITASDIKIYAILDVVARHTLIKVCPSKIKRITNIKSTETIRKSLRRLHQNGYATVIKYKKNVYATINYNENSIPFIRFPFSLLSKQQELNTKEIKCLAKIFSVQYLNKKEISYRNFSDVGVEKRHAIRTVKSLVKKGFIKKERCRYDKNEAYDGINCYKINQKCEKFFTHSIILKLLQKTQSIFDKHNFSHPPIKDKRNFSHPLILINVILATPTAKTFNFIQVKNECRTEKKPVINKGPSYEEWKIKMVLEKLFICQNEGKTDGKDIQEINVILATPYSILYSYYYRNSHMQVLKTEVSKLWLRNPFLTKSLSAVAPHNISNEKSEKQKPLIENQSDFENNKPLTKSENEKPLSEIDQIINHWNEQKPLQKIIIKRGKSLTKNFELSRRRIAAALKTDSPATIMAAMSAYADFVRHVQEYNPHLLKLKITPRVSLSNFFGFSKTQKEALKKATWCPWHGIKSWFAESKKGPDYLKDRYYTSGTLSIRDQELLEAIKCVWFVVTVFNQAKSAKRKQLIREKKNTLSTSNPYAWKEFAVFAPVTEQALQQVANWIYDKLRQSQELKHYLKNKKTKADFLTDYVELCRKEAGDRALTPHILKNRLFFEAAKRYLA